MQIYTIAKNVLGALGSKVKVPVLDAELKLPAECLRIVGACAAGNIIERGSNANGEYVKFADGTMMCFNIITHAFSTTATYQSVLVTSPATFFISANFERLAMFAYTTSFPGRFMAVGNANTEDGSTLDFGFYGPTGEPSSAAPVRIRWAAIGRWKA